MIHSRQEFLRVQSGGNSPRVNLFRSAATNTEAPEIDSAVASCCRSHGGQIRKRREVSGSGCSGIPKRRSEHFPLEMPGHSSRCYRAASPHALGQHSSLRVKVAVSRHGHDCKGISSAVQQLASATNESNRCTGSKSGLRSQTWRFRFG